MKFESETKTILKEKWDNKTSIKSELIATSYSQQSIVEASLSIIINSIRLTLLVYHHWTVEWRGSFMCITNQKENNEDDLHRIIGSFFQLCVSKESFCVPRKHSWQQPKVTRPFVMEYSWPHRRHFSGCGSSWVFICARRLQANANRFWHISHSCGLSPVKKKLDKKKIDQSVTIETRKFKKKSSTSTKKQSMTRSVMNICLFFKSLGLIYFKSFRSSLLFKLKSF